MSGYVKAAGKKVFEFLKPKPKVNKTKLDKVKSKLAKTIQKTKASGAKLDQTRFEIQNKLPLTFGRTNKKTVSNTELRKAAEARKKEKKPKNKTKHFYAPENFNKGGRVGLKRGSGLMKKKSNVKKIKETFAPRISKNKKASKFGMLSVKAGIDKNPNPTQADRIAGAKMKSKKRFV